jgi:hypothetical protein
VKSSDSSEALEKGPLRDDHAYLYARAIGPSDAIIIWHPLHHVRSVPYPAPSTSDSVWQCL